MTFVRIRIDGKAVVPVANFTSYPRIIPIGEPLGIAQDPHAWLDKLDLDSGGREKEQEKLGALIPKITDQNSLLESEPPRESEAETTGPKTAVVLELETHPISQLEILIDISPEAPPEIQLKVQNLERQHHKAFGFNDQLGNPDVKVAIDTLLGIHLISLPMYGASQEKREVIDTQINKWLTQEVIEPSKSPWATPVVIVY